MRAKFNRALFAQALENVAKVLSVENLAQDEKNEPSAAYVLVSARRPDKIALTTTDFETAISAVFTGANVEEEGSELLPADDLFKVLHETPAEDVAIRTDKKRARLTVGPLVYSCNREDVAGFPARYAPRSAEPIGTAKAKDLANLFRSTVLATNAVGSRISGTFVACRQSVYEKPKVWKARVRLEFEQGRIVGIGTDGYRMVAQKIPYEPAGNGLVDPILISVGTAKHAKKLLEKQNGHVLISKTAEQVWFSASRPRMLGFAGFFELVVGGTLYGGDYPPWRRAAPKTDPVWSCKMKIGALSEAVRKTREYARADDDVFLVFEAGALTVLPEDRLMLTTTRIPVDSDGEKEVRMTFSYKLLRSILKAFKSSTVVTVNVWGDEMPLMMRTDDCQCAVMPKRWPKPSGTF